ncbi:hypothetical protein [Sorangium sp. So ce1000]|uniref:hypothetical protein n=1 Tax=Sorangium sp. So ce1000 TaxID=3133325 RepID=UPI003F647179
MSETEPTPGILGDALVDRAWWALHCLPRDKKGKPPSYRSLEVQYKLPLAILSKLFSGERHAVEERTLPKLASALRVTPDWLLTGKGERPHPTGDVPSRVAFGSLREKQITLTYPRGTTDFRYGDLEGDARHSERDATSALWDMMTLAAKCAVPVVSSDPAADGAQLWATALLHAKELPADIVRLALDLRDGGTFDPKRTQDLGRRMLSWVIDRTEELRRADQPRAKSRKTDP